MLSFIASTLIAGIIVTSSVCAATPVNPSEATSCLANSSCGPIPGNDGIYSNLATNEPPWPGNMTGPVLNTTFGSPEPDDLLFQNLLAAEWIIFSFYQQGVETFNHSAFVDSGFPPETYERIREIRDNEAGHLRIFQNQISSNSIKPGPCQYSFGFYDAQSFLALQTVIEVGSMAFLTGLELQAQNNASKGALMAVAQTETRHNTWSLISNWRVDPFAGPVDTFYPYADQILQSTNEWVIDGSCPRENPPYPYPQQALIPLAIDKNRTPTILPGSSLSVTSQKSYQGTLFGNDTDYYAVFLHGLSNTTQPFHAHNLSTTVPVQFEQKGVFAMVIATEKSAPTRESVIAGPLILLELPLQVGFQVA